MTERQNLKNAFGLQRFLKIGTLEFNDKWKVKVVVGARVHLILFKGNGDRTALNFVYLIFGCKNVALLAFVLPHSELLEIKFTF